MADKTLEEIDDKLYQIAKEWHESSIDETRKSMVDTLIRHAVEKERQRIGVVFEVNVVMDEDEDGQAWYDNLVQKMRDCLKGRK